MSPEVACPVAGCRKREPCEHMDQRGHSPHQIAEVVHRRRDTPPVGSPRAKRVKHVPLNMLRGFCDACGTPVGMADAGAAQCHCGEAAVEDGLCETCRGPKTAPGGG